jgi:hypothetical protein
MLSIGRFPDYRLGSVWEASLVRLRFGLSLAARTSTERMGEARRRQSAFGALS